MADKAPALPPEGFSVWPSKGPFVPSFATIFFRADGERLIFGLKVQPLHCNAGGIAHGGFIATLADVWLGNSVAHRMPESARFVTSSLSVDYLKPVHPGTWIESTIDRIKIGTRLCHASGAILGDGEPVAAMRATFALLAR